AVTAALPLPAYLFPAVANRTLHAIPTARRVITQVVRADIVLDVRPVLPAITRVAAQRRTVLVRREHSFVRVARPCIIRLVVLPVVVRIILLTRSASLSAFQILHFDFRASYGVMHIL